MADRSLVLVAHNLRSSHNVGSLLRTAEGLGVIEVILSGYTPYPATSGDQRLPHISSKVTHAIQKTALGAEETLNWRHTENIEQAIAELKSVGFAVWALEQTAKAINLIKFEPPQKLALIIGRETEGIEEEVLALCDGSLEIPMKGEKESFNVVQATAMALYHCAFYG